MSDNIKVVVKVRPLISREIEDKLSYQWKVTNDTITQLDSSGKETLNQFTFDKVYDVTTKTADVYKDVAKPIVEAAIAGYNGTIFAYGQTSSGKTYTMSGTEDSPGIIQLAVLNLFDQIKCIPDRDFLVRVSLIEIYNESIKDLLNSDQKIKVRYTRQGLIKLEATEKFTASPDEVLDIMKEGEANRQTGTTNLNDKSSRSHSILQITIESHEHTEGEEITGCVNVSLLNLVDLAGSERSGQTGATGIRFKEGTHINKSLSALALVIKQLSEGPHKRHVNYRDSNLTRILQNSLGGNAKTSIICTVTPAAVEETISTLQFANRAKAIKNKPEVNAVATDRTKLQDLTNQLSKLEAELAKKCNIEEKNRLQQEQIQNLQRMILNSFGSRSIECGGARRKTWCEPPRVTISTAELRPVAEEDAPVPRFCTPALMYKSLAFPTPSFQPQLSPVSEERIMTTPPPNDNKVNLDLDSTASHTDAIIEAIQSCNEEEYAKIWQEVNKINEFRKRALKSTTGIKSPQESNPQSVNSYDCRSEDMYRSNIRGCSGYAPSESHNPYQVDKSTYNLQKDHIDELSEGTDVKSIKNYRDVANVIQNNKQHDTDVDTIHTNKKNVKDLKINPLNNRHNEYTINTNNEVSKDIAKKIVAVAPRMDTPFKVCPAKRAVLSRVPAFWDTDGSEREGEHESGGAQQPRVQGPAKRAVLSRVPAFWDTDGSEREGEHESGGAQQPRVQERCSVRLERLHIYECDHCGKAFLHKSVVREHMHSHMSCRSRSSTREDSNLDQNQKPFNCSYCDYKCNRKGDLRRHEMRHTGVKPYECSYCDYKCNRKGNLRRHEMRHTGVKPYQCNYCDYKCIQKGSLRTHEMKHTGVKPFKCNYCDYKCSRNNQLKKHEKKHTAKN